MNLKTKTLQAAFWSLIQQFGTQLITFIVQIFLARILLPEDFGLIAMVQIFVSMGKILMDSGMTSSLIREQNVTQRDYSTVFFINIILSVLLYLVVFFSAPLISLFFEQPILTLIIRVYTITFIIQALSGIQITRLIKESNIKGYNR